MSNGSPRHVLYKGPSMNPTLRAGDILYVAPYNGRKVRRGDVVVFLPQDRDHSITHRVISVDSGRIRTLGDNNSRVDNDILSYDDLVGRVVYALREKRRIPIYGGLTGRLFAVVVRSIRSIKLHIFPLLSPFYDFLARSWVLRRCVSPHIKTKIVTFKRPGGIERQLLMGQRVIGQYTPGSSRWSIKRPFRLLVDVSSLPQEDHNR